MDERCSARKVGEENKAVSHRGGGVDGPLSDSSRLRLPGQPHFYDEFTTGEQLRDSTNSSIFSGFSSIPGSQESNCSRMEVHDFLEESDDLDDDNADRRDVGEIVSESDVCSVKRGELIKSKTNADGSGAKYDFTPRGVESGFLDEEKIAFLEHSRKLREAMLRVEDLHFGEPASTDRQTL